MLHTELKQVLGGRKVLPDDWERRAEVLRETAKKGLVYSLDGATSTRRLGSGMRKYRNVFTGKVG